VTEGTKTGTMAIVAGTIALLAWWTSGSSSTTPLPGLVGKPLFEKFSDPLAAASLKILRYDSPTEDYVDFEVAKDRKSGIWTLPSHESYPADASKQMSDAANLFVGLKSIAIASEKPSEQAMFGVVEPNKQNVDKGGDGVGMLVEMRDEKGDVLADLIIGKETDRKQRFIRVPSEDVIYVAELDMSPLSTDFKQWIEPDLLKLSSNDVETIGVRDYQIVSSDQGSELIKNYDADLSFVTTNGQWQPKKIISFEAKPPVERVLTADEQLNSTKLNEMKSALDSLRIADVLKKPAGLAGDLRGDKSLLSNRESLTSLRKRGFYPNPNQKDGETVDFYSTSGELIVTLKDGVQYLLRFGGAAGADIKDAGTDDAGKGSEISINRFLLVTTRIDEDKFPQPDLEKLPETVEELKAIENLKKEPVVEPAVQPENNVPAPNVTLDDPSIDKPATSDVPAASTDPVPSTDPIPDPAPIAEPTLDSPAPEVKPSPVSSFSTRQSGKLVSFQDPQDPLDPQTPEVGEKDTDDKKSDVPAPPAEPTEEEWKEKLEAARETITKNNKRKIDQRNEKLEAAKKKIAELNGRFADWYYVVSEDDYKKLRISLADLIQPKTAPAASGGGLPGGGGFPGGGFPGGFQPK